MSETEDSKEEDFINEFSKQMKRMTLDLNKQDMVFVPYELYKQNLELMTENLREVYDILHNITMEKMFSVDFNLGELSFSMSGRHEDSEKIIDAFGKFVDKVLLQVLDEKKIESIKKEIRRSKNDTERGYC